MFFSNVHERIFEMDDTSVEKIQGNDLYFSDPINIYAVSNCKRYISMWRVLRLYSNRRSDNQSNHGL